MKILLVEPMGIATDQVSIPDLEVLVYTAHGAVFFDNILKIIFPQIVIIFGLSPREKWMEYVEIVRAQKAFRHVKLILTGHGFSEQDQLYLSDLDVEVVKMSTINTHMVTNLVRALAKREQFRPDPLRDRIKIIPERMSVYIEGTEVPLLKKEFVLFQLFYEHPDKLISRKEIFDYVWKDKTTKSDRTIDVHVSRLRKKLNFNNIISFRNQGFKLVSRI